MGCAPATQVCPIGQGSLPPGKSCGSPPSAKGIPSNVTSLAGPLSEIDRLPVGEDRRPIVGELAVIDVIDLEPVMQDEDGPDQRRLAVAHAAAPPRASP